MCTFYVNRYIQSQISKDLIVCVCVLPYGLNTSQTENSDSYFSDKFQHHVKLGHIFLFVVVFRLLLLSKSTSGMKIY